MLRFEDIKPAAEQAFNKNELFEFLTGKNGYELMVMDATIKVPTDWTRIIPYGIYALYMETQNENLVNEFTHAIERALKGTYMDFWCAFYVLFVQYSNEKRGKAPFVLDPKITNGVKDFIVKNRASMEKLFPYGEGDIDMYSDIVRLNNNFVRRWGSSFLV